MWKLKRSYRPIFIKDGFNQIIPVNIRSGIKGKDCRKSFCSKWEFFAYNDLDIALKGIFLFDLPITKFHQSLIKRMKIPST